MITWQETSSKPHGRCHKDHQKRGISTGALWFKIQQQQKQTTKISAERINAMKVSSSDKFL